jgi:hypothetical protein
VPHFSPFARHLRRRAKKESYAGSNSLDRNVPCTPAGTLRSLRPRFFEWLFQKFETSCALRRTTPHDRKDSLVCRLRSKYTAGQLPQMSGLLAARGGELSEIMSHPEFFELTFNIRQAA